MNANRRAFLASGVTAALGAAALHPSTGKACEDEDSAPKIDQLAVIDYGRSFVCGTASFNNVRFWVESRTVLFDGDRRHEFLQMGSCKSENTFGEKDLFHADNYDFLPILADDGHWLVFRRKNRITEDYRSIKKEIWGPACVRLRFGRRVLSLETFDDIQGATGMASPLVSRTEIADERSGLRAVIEAPVKTMNIEPEKKLYQIDTGPVALPDITRRFDPPIDCLRLAYIAFNTPHFADFVIEQPTPVLEEGRETARVYHYSNPISLPAKNSLIVMEDE
jgi:hypothetical protein